MRGVVVWRVGDALRMASSAGISNGGVVNREGEMAGVSEEADGQTSRTLTRRHLRQQIAGAARRRKRDNI